MDMNYDQLVRSAEAWMPVVLTYLGNAVLALYLLFLVTLTRIVAEAGAGWHFGPNFNPHAMIFAGFGQTGFAPKDLTMLAYTYWIDQDYRDNPMPHQLEAMKMGAASAAAPRRLLAALLLAAALGALAAFWANLHIYYEYGAATAKARPWITSVGVLNWLVNLLGDHRS